MGHNNNSTLTLPSGENLILDATSGTFGDTVMTITPLVKTGTFTFDPGFKATAACESKITYIDGAKGILLHGGYPIDQLAKHKSFTDVAHLLMHGELPTNQERDTLHQVLKQHQHLEDKAQSFFQGFPSNAHPMAMLLGLIGGLSAYYHADFDLNNKQHREREALRLIALVPTIAAMAYRHSTQQAFIAPRDDLDYASNFLNMMFASFDGSDNKVLSQALDRIFILHADHEQNASTSTVRLAGSTGTHPFAAVAAGIAALWGNAHGGANEACLNMLHTIASEDHIDEYIAKAKDPNDPFRLMGFGHRVYKSYDPRASIMRQTCHEVLEAVGAHDNPIFKLAMTLEKIALEDDYFISRNLYPNVDFYSGITLSAMGIPANMFTVIFALARTTGWVAHWLEMTGGDYQLGRPRQLYTGPSTRDVPEAGSS
jgi:citrate synthase